MLYQRAKKKNEKINLRNTDDEKTNETMTIIWGTIQFCELYKCILALLFSFANFK